MRPRLFAVVAVIAVALVIPSVHAQGTLSPIEELGRLLYLDENLSEPTGQSCGSCHHPDFAFVDPDFELPVSEGVLPGKFGGRNSPMAAYAMYAPLLHFDTEEGLWIGGQFWDGRGTGEVLGDPLADQALGPFLAPVEMANPSRSFVVNDVATGPYANLFIDVWGDIFSDVDAAYEAVALSIAAFERTPLFAPFDSKYDVYLQTCLAAGGDKEDCAVGEGKTAKKVARKFFDREELRGFQLFVGENDNDGYLDRNEGAMCAACHIAEWTEAAGNVVVPSWSPDGSVPPLFTDFTFDNLGVPRNYEYPMDPSAGLDLGLGPVVGDPDENGKFKVMTLRNIGETGPYAHSGLFKSLKEIVNFYNTRDVAGALPMGENWPPSEYPDTVNFDELGDLGLSDADEDALVEFMKTLTDGWRP